MGNHCFPAGRRSPMPERSGPSEIHWRLSDLASEVYPNGFCGCGAGFALSLTVCLRVWCRKCLCWGSQARMAHKRARWDQCVGITVLASRLTILPGRA